MFKKVIILYSIIIALNPPINLSYGAEIRKAAANITQNFKMLGIDYNSVTEAAQNWLAETTTLTPALSLSAPAPWHNLNLKNTLADTSEQTQPTNIDLHTYHNYHRANYSKRHIKTLTSTPSLSTKSTSSSPFQSIKHNNFKSHVYPTTIKKINTSSRSLNNKLHSRCHHQLSPLNSNIQHPQIEIEKDTKSQGQEYHKPLLLPPPLKPSDLNLHHLPDVAEHKKRTNPSASLTYWHYLPQSTLQTKHIISLVRSKNDTTIRNSKDNIFKKRLISFSSNENLTAKNFQRQEHFYDSVLRNDKVFDKKVSQGRKTHPAHEAGIAAADDKEDFVRKSLQNAQEFYVKFNNSDGCGNNDDYYEDGGYDMYSNAAKTNDDNDPQILNSSTPQVIKEPSKTLAVASATAFDKVDSLNIENMTFAAASTGRQRQLDKDDIKYSLTKSPLTSLLRDTNKTQNIAVKAKFQSTPINGIHTRGQLRNFYAKAEIVSVETPSAKTHSSSLLIAPASKDLTAFSSGRKVKKIKNKLKKFLFPLLLAYKLKFVALIPLLIGGLILLVGSTGLAGFFFALFTAVMSLKSGKRSAIVVRKS